MLWGSGQQWAMLHQELPSWQNIANVALVAISTATLRLYDDHRRLMTKNQKTEQNLLKASKKVELQANEIEELKRLRTKSTEMVRELESATEKSLLEARKKAELQAEKVNELERLHTQDPEMVRELESAILEQETRFQTLHQNNLKQIDDIEQLQKEVSAIRKSQFIFFFDLPYELRERIYDMVALAEMGNKTRTLYAPFCPTGPSAAAVLRDPAPALVSRKCRSEYLPRHFRVKTIRVQGPLGRPTEAALRCFTQRLPMIRNFELGYLALYEVRFSGDFQGRNWSLPKLPSQEEGYAMRKTYSTFNQSELKRDLDARISEIVQSSIVWTDGVASMSILGLRQILWLLFTTKEGRGISYYGRGSLKDGARANSETFVELSQAPCP